MLSITFGHVVQNLRNSAIFVRLSARFLIELTRTFKMEPGNPKLVHGTDSQKIRTTVPVPAISPPQPVVLSPPHVI